MRTHRGETRGGKKEMLQQDKKSLTCGASRRRLWASREARPFRGTSWLVCTRAARPVSLRVHLDGSRAVVALHEIGVRFIVILAPGLHVNFRPSPPRGCARWSLDRRRAGANATAQHPSGGRPFTPQLRRFPATVADHEVRARAARTRCRLCNRCATAWPRQARSRASRRRSVRTSRRRRTRAVGLRACGSSS